MKNKGNGNDLIVKDRGPIWSAKVGVYSYLADGSRISNIQAKRWKVKEILN